MPSYQITINDFTMDNSDSEYSDVTVDDSNEDEINSNNKRVLDNSVYSPPVNYIILLIITYFYYNKYDNINIYIIWYILFLHI